MPRPAVIRFTAPGAMSCEVPSESRWCSSPLSSQVTVCRPMCGCGPMRMPGALARSTGPKWSRKHHAPTMRRPRVGSARRTRRPSPSSTVVASMRSGIIATPSALLPPCALCACGPRSILGWGIGAALKRRSTAGTALFRDGQQAADLLLVGRVALAMLAHQVAFLELDRDQDVAERNDGKQQVAGGHGRRRPEGDDEAHVERVAHELVEQ